MGDVSGLGSDNDISTPPMTNRQGCGQRRVYGAARPASADSGQSLDGHLSPKRWREAPTWPGWELLPELSETLTKVFRQSKEIHSDIRKYQRANSSVLGRGLDDLVRSCLLAH